MRRLLLSCAAVVAVAPPLAAQQAVSPPFNINAPGGERPFQITNPGGSRPFDINRPGTTGVVLPAPAPEPSPPPSEQPPSEDSIPEISPGVNGPENTGVLIRQPSEIPPSVPLADGSAYVPGSEIDPNAILLAGLCWAVPPATAEFPENALVALPGGTLWRPGDRVAPTQQVWAWFCQVLRATGAEAGASVGASSGLGAVPGSFAGAVAAPEVGSAVIPIARLNPPATPDDPPTFMAGAEGFEPGQQPPPGAFVELRYCWAVPAASQQPPRALIDQARIAGGIAIPGVPELWDGVSPLPPETYVPAEWCGWAKWALRVP
jgi:hypothetical protein